MRPFSHPFPRSVLAAATLALAAALALPASARAGTVTDTVARLEATLGGRIGVELRGEGSPTPLASIRADERFPMASTFKVLLCGAVLARVDAGEEQLDRRVSYGPEALVTYSPVTEKRAGGSMTVGELCEATITLSDNTAANLLLASLGGPEGLTTFLREIGDPTTRLDRNEPSLNAAVPGDERDTTSPKAVLASLETLIFGDALSDASRRQLEDWMIADKVADALIRKHLPEGWTIGDKTGAGANGSRAIIAVIRPPHRTPYLAAIYLTGSSADFDTRNAAIAEIGKAMVEEIGAH
ncbi:class A beta-lactamase [Stappia sp.]|uniref:class A beta-lactamase n=1 Tax=Stappia sp. TaxID=1870903 RepID=UPI003A991CCF